MTARLAQLQEVSTRTRDCTNFGDRSLLRGATVATLLHNFGQILKGSEGSAKNYEQSAPTRSIDVFISHNWSIPRQGKFLALALHFNGGAAVIAALVVCIVAVGLTSVGVFPTVKFVWKDRDFEQGLACHLIFIVIFPAVLLFWHEIKAYLGFEGMTVFLDKVSIHQTDVDRKREGIRGLAAFLRDSRTLFIVSSDVYLQRLWTVYELASHLVMQPEGQIVVMPMFVPKLVLRVLLHWFLFTSLHILLSLEFVWAYVQLPTDVSCSLQMMLTVVLVAPAATGLVICQWEWAKKRSGLQRLLEGFSITRAACTCEEDRPIIEGNIASFMQDVGLAKPDAGDGAALAAFDILVREEVPKALARSFGRAGIPYRYVVLMFLSQSMRVVDKLPVFFIGGIPVIRFCLDASMHFTINFALLPFALAIGDCVAMRCVDQSKARLMAMHTVTFCSLCALWALLDGTASCAEDSWICLASYLGLTALLWAACCLACWPVTAAEVKRSSSIDFMHTISDLSADLRSVMRQVADCIWSTEVMTAVTYRMLGIDPESTSKLEEYLGEFYYRIFKKLTEGKYEPEIGEVEREKDAEATKLERAFDARDKLPPGQMVRRRILKDELIGDPQPQSKSGANMSEAVGTV